MDFTTPVFPLIFLAFLAGAAILRSSGSDYKKADKTSYTPKLARKGFAHIGEQTPGMELFDSIIEDKIEENGELEVGLSFLREALGTVRSNLPKVESLGEGCREFGWGGYPSSAQVSYRLGSSGSDSLFLMHWGRTCREHLVLHKLDDIESKDNVRILPSPSVYHTHLDKRDLPIPEDYWPIIYEIRKQARLKAEKMSMAK